MQQLKNILFIIIGITTMSCSTNQKNKEDNFKYSTEQFADLRIQRYQVPGFEELSLRQKQLTYYLYQASLSGRDMIYDQNYKHNLYIRRTLEGIIKTYDGDKSTPDFQKFMTYVKRVWFSNGIHHHYSNKKIIPEFSKEYFARLISGTDEYELPLQNMDTPSDLIKKLTPILFDPKIDGMKVNQDPNVDMIKSSAVNFYEGVTQKEVEAFYKKIVDPKDLEPVSYGLNSKLLREKGEVFERHWKANSMYAAPIQKIIYWLGKAVEVAENEQQKKCFQLLIEYYETGDLKKWDEYNTAWVKDTTSVVDFVNGFIETYNDPLGYRANYESIVSIKDNEATKRIKAISDNAQWFEDNSPILAEHKKKKVKGISAKVITVVVESGDASPSTPIGINLPNANWIRKEHGSKSVNLGNIVHSYNMFANTSGVLEEFAYSQEEIERAKKYGALSDDLHTDMHEVIGHASGQLNPGVGETNETLKNYASTLEEARADLVALYYVFDQKLVDIGVMPSLDAGKAQYDGYIKNGLMIQLARIQPGENVEEAHMRNRQLIAKWVYEKGLSDNVIEKKVKDGKTYFVINDYNKLKNLFGQLLREIQRIKSEGDYTAGKILVENYGVKVDQEIHKEVLERYKKLNISPYAGFINPKLVLVMNGNQIIDVKIEYPEDFTKQMLEYAKEYSFLPTYN
ncbi:MAG: dihydrofolate reductase [Ignavibacteriales bacterium]|nr:MAG: dihydrofolate reductase [Ignavibacteriales bacterium]